MAVKQVMPEKIVVRKNKSSTKSGEKDSNSELKSPKKEILDENKKRSSVLGWIQDASLEVASSENSAEYSAGQRELEFSVGMRQQELGEIVRSELRARALVHAQGVVLALVEASYVCDMAPNLVSESLPHEMYIQLKPRLEALLEMGGHTPPLPVSLKQVEA